MAELKIITCLGPEDDLDAFILRLINENPFDLTRWEIASESLGRIKNPHTVNALIDVLKRNESWAAYFNAAKILSRVKDPRAVDVLIDVIKHDESLARIKVAEILGQIKDPRAVDPLISALSSDSYKLRKEAVISLGKIKDPRAVSALIDALKDEYNDVRIEAVKSLGQIEYPCVMDALIESLDDTNREVRLCAVDSLEKMNEPRALFPLLTNTLADGDDERCSHAVMELVNHIDDPRSVDLLITLIKGEVYGSNLRRTAENALANIKDSHIIDPRLATAMADALKLRTEKAHNGRRLAFAETRMGKPLMPLWDGSESSADYARRVGVEPTLNLDLGEGIRLELVLIPAGKFMMGSKASPWAIDAKYQNNETQHEVTISYPYYMGKYVVTEKQYKSVMGRNPCEFRSEGYPVTDVSWKDAQDCCKKLSAVTGKTVLLPTEAEWEYACRAGSTTLFHTGNNWDFDMKRAGWYYGTSLSLDMDCKYYISRQQPNPVGQKEPNAWGLYDMHGNVNEWCQDWYGSYSSDPVTDPMGPIEPEGFSGWECRVQRGGSYLSHPEECRSAYRKPAQPDMLSSTWQTGFRVVVLEMSSIERRRN
jgi:formylglycine-generating enzyme required for sulfatase activity/HEAT repeat protein